MNNKQISHLISVFHDRTAPEQGNLIGYGALIEFLKLAVPMPIKLSIISMKRRQYENDNWRVFTPRHQPNETIYDHLVFAIKYEGINLLFFKKLFELLPSDTIVKWIYNEPHSQYTRKIWFLFEWLMQLPLTIPDLKEGNYIKIIDEDLQYGLSKSYNSTRHRVKNNLPGCIDFCPLIHKTVKIKDYIAKDLSNKSNIVISGLRKDMLLRTSAFLLLKDSKDSFTIEGETPTQNRAFRWGKAIGEAGSKPLSKEEILRLQQLIIENSRFVQMGYRNEGGFVGEHDRITGEPIPEHISARHQDIENLMKALFATAQQLEESVYHPVFVAAEIAFGFVFIHPLVDGNGRLHRYLIHHLLAKMKFTPQGIIFPVSAAILAKMDDYRKVLESFSHPLLEFIDWKKTDKNNVEILNDTKDYYRYFDATLFVEFLFDSIDYTISKSIPEEVEYLQKYDSMKAWLDDRFQMPDKMVALIIRFLEQNNGSLSKRAKEKEFAAITNEEVAEIEEYYNSLVNI